MDCDGAIHRVYHYLDGELTVWKRRAIKAHLHLGEVLRTGRKVDEVSAGDRLTRERFMRSMRHVASVRAPHTVAALGTPPDVRASASTASSARRFSGRSSTSRTLGPGALTSAARRA